MKVKGGLFLISVITFLLSYYLPSFIHKELDIADLSKKFQYQFNKQEAELLTYLNLISYDIETNGIEIVNSSDWVKKTNKLYSTNGLIFTVSNNDSLVFLSHNALPINSVSLDNTSKFKIVLLDNGWYLVNQFCEDGLLITAYGLIKKEYSYKNQFLRNTFFKLYDDIPSTVSISVNSASDGSSIFDLEENYALSLIFQESSLMIDSKAVKSIAIISDLLFIICSLTLTLIWVNVIAQRNSNKALLISLFLFLLLRVILFFSGFPYTLLSHDIFSATHFASSLWVPSLGDLFVNTVFLLLLVIIVYNHLRIPFSDSRSRRYLILFLFFVLSIISIALATFATLQSLKNLVINSSLNFNVKFIFSLDIYHLIGFLSLTGIFFILFFVLLLISKILKSFIANSAFKKKILVILILGLSLFVGLLFFYFILPDDIKVLQPVLFIISISIFVGIVFRKKTQNEKATNIPISDALIAFLLFAIIGTVALFNFNKEKEIQFRQNVALRISNEQDPIAEFLFKQIEESLFTDLNFAENVLNNPYDEEGALTYLKREYFYDFWTKYDIQLTVCAPDEKLFFKPIESQYNCKEYFLSYLEQFSRPTLSRNLHYLDNNTGRNSYLAIIPLKDLKGVVKYNVYIEFESRFIPKELGFPELLIDENIDLSRNLGDYSYAIYKNDLMTHKFGVFAYSIYVNSYPINDDKNFQHFYLDGYSHLIYVRDRNTKIIVSKPGETLLDKIAPFSYLFIFFLLGVLFIWIINIIKSERKPSLTNFRSRLQLSVLAVVLASVLTIGGASAWFIVNIYNSKNEKIINEKAHSILIELENRIGREASIDNSYGEYLNQMLMALSQVFFADINLFGVDGVLIASSRMKIYDEGLISKIMDPVALNALRAKMKSLYIDNEKIGELEYISAYVPLRNTNGDLLAYINLPYFAQHSELRNEISYFLVAFANIYLLLLLASVIIAFFISNLVTKPLQIIRSSISSLAIGKVNKKIEWSRKDEIGQLITEYNRMIDELAVSAELLARSERESAWREMAKQVAHEIKNPLTPMRLNVQYLQKAWNDKVDNWDERLERFTKAMVEQIDNLSLIAGEFSDFAKMPATNNEIINLVDFVRDVPELYKGFDKVIINLELPLEKEKLFVFVDSKQLLRVFNNLIKNAVQAYSKNELAKIDIVIQKETSFVKIALTDYGSGIDDNLKANIFQPYFTTKTAGMGLGLAMVKSITESFRGHISFDSTLNRGTTFTIRLPLYGNN